MKQVKLMLALLTTVLICFVNAQTTKLLTGKITDEKGAAINGAVIIKCKSKKGVISDNRGNFSLSLDSNTTCITVSAIGFQTQSISIKNKSNITIKMVAASSNLEEVSVQVPYGIVKKKAFSVGSAAILYGAVAGISVTDNYNLNRNYTSINDTVDDEENNREGYDNIKENPFFNAAQNPLSTFSIDVDAAAYSNVRRIINEGKLPPAGAVRIEEMINYFKYNYPQPKNNLPFTINTEQSICPWNPKHQLVLIGLQGKEIAEENLPPTSLTFLIDVSGSMYSQNKLPLVKQSLLMLTNKLREQDKVAIVVYASAAGLVLPATNNKEEIRKAIENLQSGGSTAGGAGIKLAYKTAKNNFLENGNNRVILCTDGDFNVGASSDDELERLIEEERKYGVFLTVLGFGMSNYQDAKMQKLADKGNGNHAYIDGLNEAKKVLMNEFGGTLFTIAKDVKFQIEFNPFQVKEYRLIGYENRVLAKEDFNNDKKDAGELGSGHTVTALYEIVPLGTNENNTTSVDELHFIDNELKSKGKNNELIFVKLRYKNTTDSSSKLIEHIVTKHNVNIEKASENMRFAAAVAQFGMLLRNSTYKGNSTYKNIISLAQGALGKDKEGYRKEFVELVKKVDNYSNTTTIIE